MKKNSVGKNCLGMNVLFLLGCKVQTGIISDVTSNHMLLHSMVQLPFHEKLDFLVIYHDKRVLIPVKAGVLVRKDNKCYTTYIEVHHPTKAYLEIVESLGSSCHNGS